MAELIDKQKTPNDMIKPLGIKNEDYLLYMERMMYNVVKQAPTVDATEVVRCKDCVHRPSRIPGASDDHEGLNLEFPDDWCPMQCEDGWYNRMPGDDFFCGYGNKGEKNNG